MIAGGRAPDTERAQPRRGQGRDRGRTAGSRSTSTSGPRTRRSTRSATSSAAPRSPTRPPRRASSRSRRSPAPTTHPIDVDLVPGATFCHPQVASVGMTEAEAKEAGQRGQGRPSSSSAASAPPPSTTTARGWSSSSPSPKYGEILGAHIVGNRACDMISELVDMMALEGGYQELARIIHPHPTISEAVLDAARAVDGWATHAVTSRASTTTRCAAGLDAADPVQRDISALEIDRASARGRATVRLARPTIGCDNHVGSQHAARPGSRRGRGRVGRRLRRRLRRAARPSYRPLASEADDHVRPKLGRGPDSSADGATLDRRRRAARRRSTARARSSWSRPSSGSS